MSVYLPRPFPLNPREEAVIQYRIDANINWLVAHDPQDDLWIAVCPSLNLNADGMTREELDSCMAEVVHLLFADLHESGEFDEFLQDHGWTASLGTGESSSGRATFSVPFQITEKDSVEELVHT